MTARAWILAVLLLLGCGGAAGDPVEELERTGRFSSGSFAVERVSTASVALEYTPGLVVYGRMAMLLFGALCVGVTVLSVVPTQRVGARGIGLVMGLCAVGGVGLCSRENAHSRTLLDLSSRTVYRTETTVLGRVVQSPPRSLRGARFTVENVEANEVSNFYRVQLRYAGELEVRVASFSTAPPAIRLRDWLQARLEAPRSSSPE